MINEVSHSLDPVMLMHILESLEDDRAVSAIAFELKLTANKTTIKRLSGTIRLMGYSVVAKAVWCKESQNSTRQATVKPKSGE